MSGSLICLRNLATLLHQIARTLDHERHEFPNPSVPSFRKERTSDETLDGESRCSAGLGLVLVSSWVVLPSGTVAVVFSE
jgi:hypothetical protein